MRYWDEHRNAGPARPLFVTYDVEAPTVIQADVNYGNTNLATADSIPFEVTCSDLVAPTNRLTMSIVQTNGDAPFTLVNELPYAPLVTASVINSDGPGTVEITCTDQAGNTSDPTTVNFRLDTVNPLTGPGGSSVRINSGDTYTNQGIVSLAITGIDNVGGSGIAQVAIANGNIDCATASYQPWSPAANDSNVMTLNAWALPNGEVEHTVSVCVMDQAGRTASVADSINLDTVAPEGNFTMSGAAEYQGSLFIGSAVLVNDNLVITPTIGAQEVADRIQVGAAIGDVDCSQVQFEDYSVGLQLSRPIGASGPKVVTVCFKDLAGNETRLTKGITYDQASPTIVGEPVVNLGQSFLSDANDVAIDVTCTDADTASANLSLSLTTAGGDELFAGPYAPRVVINVPLEATGEQTLSAVCSDAAGNVSNAVNFNYTLDLTPPVTGVNGSLVSINNAAIATNRRSVVVDLTAADNAAGSGVVAMAVGEGVLDCDTAEFEALRANFEMTLSDGDGNKTVAVCLKDRAGNVAQVSDNILLDTVAPTGGVTLTNGSVVANADFAYTIQRDSIDVAQTAVGLGFLDCDAGTTVYKVYSSDEATITLPAEGEYDLSVCLRDTAGNTTKYVERVELDLTPPTGFITLNDGAAYTSTRDVIVKLTASPDVAEVKYRNNTANCDVNNNYVPIDLATTHQLSFGDGIKSVVACIRDAAGNATELDDQSITLDTLPPVPLVMQSENQPNNQGVLINDGARIVNSTNVTVTLSAEEGVGSNGFAGSGIAEFRLSSTDACKNGNWQAWLPDANGLVSVNVNIEAGDNDERTIAALFRDKAGNVSQTCVVDTVRVDTVPLTLSEFSLAGDKELTTGRVVTVSLDASGTGDCSTYEVSENPAFPDDNTTTRLPCVAGNRSFTLSAGDEVKTVYGRIIDTAGNISSVLSDTIELDTEDPTLANITATRTDGSIGAFSNDRDVQINLGSPVGGTSIVYRLYDSSVNCPVVDDLTSSREFSSSFFASFTSDGQKTICLAISDDAGNTSRVRKASITVDTIAPTAPTLDPKNLSGVNSSCVNITPSGNLDPNFWKFQYRQAGGKLGRFTHRFRRGDHHPSLPRQRQCHRGARRR